MPGFRGQGAPACPIGHKRRHSKAGARADYGLCFMNVAIRPGYQSGILAARGQAGPGLNLEIVDQSGQAGKVGLAEVYFQAGI